MSLAITHLRKIVLTYEPLIIRLHLKPHIMPEQIQKNQLCLCVIAILAWSLKLDEKLFWI